jgi:RHS repeat-associated protein
VVLPDNTQYQFKYDCDSSTNNIACGSPSGQSAYYGTLISVILPTGGQINYGYTTFSDSYGNKSRWLNSRTSAGGTWFYTPQVLSTCSSSQVGCQEKVTVLKPSGASATYTFTLNNGTWPVQVQGSDSSGNSFETVANTYDFSNSCPFQNCVGASYVRPLSRVTTIPVPGGTSISKKTAYTYDSPQKGNVTAIMEWKFYPGTNPSFPSVPDRATYIVYATPGTNIINKPARTTLCNNSGSDPDCPGGGSKGSQTKVTYDSYGTNLCGGPSGLVPVTGIANHDDAGFGSGNLARGNPTQIQRWVSGTTFLTTSLSYDTTGQVVQSVDAVGNPSCYNYADNFFYETGPSSMSAYTPPAPTNAYPKTVTMGGLTSTFGYYFGSGKLASSTDPNNAITSYFFSDLRDRPTETRYPFGWKMVNYTSATQADSYVAVADASASTGCTSCKHEQVNLDAWGRKANQKLVNAPGGAINVDTTYDPIGRVSTVSHAYVNPTDPSHVFETFTYDGADRRIASTHPDNQSSQEAYGPNVIFLGGVTAQQSSPTMYGYGYPVISVDETGEQKQQWIDGFGMVIEVDEPTTTSGTPGTGTVTIGGSERSKRGDCAQYNQKTGECIRWNTIYDAGTVSITVNGFIASTNYGQGSTTSSIVTALASALASSPVNIVVNANVIMLSAKTTGAGTNYTLTTSVNYDSADFTSASFSATPSGATLTGGSNAPGSSLATPIVTNYVYDVAGNLTNVVQGLQTRAFTYDGLGRNTSITTPEAGTDNFYFTQPDNVSLCAGSPKAVCRKTGARGITTTYTYDTLSRLTGKAYSNTSLMPNVCTTIPNNSAANMCNYYDQGGAVASALGRLTSVTDSSGSETFTYDQGGGVTQKQKVIGTTTYPISYQYNAGGELTQITYPSGRVVYVTPDSIGRFNAVASNLPTSVSVTIPYTGYNAAGQILNITYGNGVVGNFTYSAARQQLTNLTYTAGTYPNETLFSLNYGYMNGQANCGASTAAGNNGLIQCIQDTMDNGRSVIYSYDALARLSTATTTGSSGYAQWGLSWVYDRYGNRVSQNQTAGSPPMNSLTFATTPAPPANPPGGAYTNRPDGYSFDTSGNMLNDGSNTLAYDAENCLTTSANSSTGTSTYTCDSHGIRVKKVLQGSTTTVYVFSGGKDIAEYDNGAAISSPSREYIYLGSQLAATLQGTTVTYHHSDHLSVRLSTGGLSNSQNYGQTVGEQGHYPFGEQWYATNTTTKFFFTSYERDSSDSGNDYAMARFYINRFGRFSCVDPSLGTPGDPQSWNRYAYARNNPVNITDLTGQNWLFQLIGAILILLSFIPGLQWLGPIGMSIAGAAWGIPGHLGNTLGTPPTVPDPLGNTQATLNSIYHPVNPNLFVISNFSSANWADGWLNLAALGPCIQIHYNVYTDFFRPAGRGKNGQFFGVTPASKAYDYGSGGRVIGVTIDTGQSSAQVNRDAGPPTAPGADASGAYTDWDAPEVVHVGVDRSVTDYGVRFMQIVELGNSLAAQTGMPAEEAKKRDDRFNPPGMDLWNCLVERHAVRFGD